MLRPSRARVVAGAALVLLSVGCSADDTPPSPPATAESPAAGAADEPTDPGSSPSGGEDDATGAAASPISIAGGERPTVSWTAVEGAATYRVTVLPDDGQPWAWEATATSIVVGGGEPDGGGLGYRLTSGAVVTVTAHDSDGRVIQLDQRRIDTPSD